MDLMHLFYLGLIFVRLYFLLFSLFILQVFVGEQR